MSTEQLESAAPELDIFDLLRRFIKSALHLLLPGILMIVLLAGAMCFRAKNSYVAQYRASASFTVMVTDPLYARQQYYNNAVAEQLAATFPYILTSGVLSEQVKDTLGIDYMPTVTADAIGNTNIFTLTVTSIDPQLAYDVLNCIIEVYPSVSEFVVGPTELTLLDESGLPTQPTSRPNYIRSALKGALLGAMAWAALALLYWVTYQTISNEEELAKIVNLPCIGRLPRVRGVGKKKNKYPILNDSNDKFGFNESIRLLRIRVEKAMKKDNAQVLLVTSAIPNEGKTTIAINLAIALAHKGKRTLLVDCDLRNPSVGAVLGAKNNRGFTEVLKGQCVAEDVFRCTKTENFFVVLGGHPVSNPEGLLTSVNMQAFMEEAREIFDYVILDTPPCAMMADAVEIGALADCALLTVRQDFAARQQILEGVQTLGNSKKPILGTVFNMSTPLLGQGGYNGYYGYGYGYYGNYGTSGKSSDSETQ